MPKIRIPSRRKGGWRWSKHQIGRRLVTNLTHEQVPFLSSFLLRPFRFFCFLASLPQPATPKNPNIHVWRHAKYLSLLVWNKATGDAIGDGVSKRTIGKEGKRTSRISLTTYCIFLREPFYRNEKWSSLNIRRNNHNSAYELNSKSNVSRASISLISSPSLKSKTDIAHVMSIVVTIEESVNDVKSSM